jgi:septal ring factor EnvC (AmiA/AmiB activator)
MGFGSTAKKLQKVTDMADKLYERFEKLREQVSDLTGTVEETNDRVADLEAELAEQRAIVEALAERRGVDADAVVEDATAGEEAAADGGDGGE